MQDLLQQSRAIIDQALAAYQPYAVVAMVSGGDDSVTAWHVARALGVRIDFVLHGRTGTGIPQTTQYVRETDHGESLYIEADAGDSYERYVLRKGFFGRGETAHNYAYHVLKSEHFKKAISQYIRQGRRGRTILLLNGARKQESAARSRKIPDPIRKDDNNVWVSLIHDWTKPQCLDFLVDSKVARNPVTQTLCRSGECMCGTTQDAQARREAAYWYPDWGQWLDRLEQRVMQHYPWAWGQDVPRWFAQQQAGQQWMGEDFMPMCHSCVMRGD